MNKLTNKLLSLSAMLLLFMAFSASSALAQNYAKPNGTDIAVPAAGDCDVFAAPCNLATAVREALTAGGGTTVTAILPNDGGTVIVGTGKSQFDLFPGEGHGNFPGLDL